MNERNISIKMVLVASVCGFFTISADSSTVSLMSVAGGKPTRNEYVQKWGVRTQDFGRKFRSDGEIIVEQISSSVPCNMAYPNEKVELIVQIRNLTNNQLELKGRWILIDHSLKTMSEDVFDLGIEVNDTIKSDYITIALPPKGFTHVSVSPDLSEKFGSAVLLFERQDTETRLFVSGLARIMKPDLSPGQQFYQVCMDLTEPEAVKRLHTAPNRIGVPFIPSYDKGCKKKYDEIAQKLLEIKKTGFPVCVEFGAGPSKGKYLPLGRTRPHLSDDNILLETKSDYAWLPEYDSEFKERVKWIVKEFGYPRGPVNALMLWNEPWNGISISGWGADDLRYREIYTVMCEAAEEVMAENPDIKVLLGGCDSSANTFDKFFPDGDMKFLKWLDFVSLHYQGLSPSNPRFFRNRVHKNGRVKFWDTESWVANSEDRVPGVLAGMLAAGHDRIIGIQGNSVVAGGYNVTAFLENGATERRRQFNAWPVAPALATFQNFVGNRKFSGLLWEGLPWVYKFQGQNEDDLTLVVCGDISSVFDSKGRTGVVPFRTAHGNETINGTLRIYDADNFSLYDGNGNLIASEGGIIVVPLDDRSFYLRSNGKPGSADKLLKAVSCAEIDGYNPVAPVFYDATKPIDDGAVFSVDLKNILNRDIQGSLSVEAKGLELAYEKTIKIGAHEKYSVSIKVLSGNKSEDNSYPFKLVFDAGKDGISKLNETLHCNVIHNFSPEINGILDDWKGALPQPVYAGKSGATIMEKAWLPMLKHDDQAPEGVAVAWLAADEENFYFAAKISDTTPDPGMFRFETRDEDADFYPEEVMQYDIDKTIAMKRSNTKAKIEGSNAVWSSLVNKMSFSIKPPDGGARLAIRFADDDHMLRRHQTITIIDEEIGLKLFSYDLRPMMEHSWFRVNISRACRVDIQTRNWLKPQIVAIAIDPPEKGLNKPAVETDSNKGFEQTYGTLGIIKPGKDNTNLGFKWNNTISLTKMKWPENVRRFSYRRRPELPHGTNPAHDNVQLAFNVLSDEEKPWYPAAPGTFKGYAGYWDTDYEFALNPVAKKYGGGFEIWKLRAPYLPDKHYYPRSPKHPLEGAVKNGKLIIKYDGKYRIVEAAIPWSEIPEVKTARDLGKTVKFSYRVNNNKGKNACMELAYMRSVSKRNGSFRPVWVEHWANELEFGWEK